MTISINLLPWREEKRERNKCFFLISFGLSTSIATAIALSTYFILNNHIFFQKERNALIQAEIKKYDKQIKEIKTLKEIKASLIARMNIIQKLQQNRPATVHLFDELVKVVPKSIYLLSAERTGDQLMLTGHTDANSSVSLLMQKLRENFWLNKPFLEEVEEVTNDKKSKLYKQFRLKVVLKPKDKQNQEEDFFDE